MEGKGGWGGGGREVEAVVRLNHCRPESAHHHHDPPAKQPRPAPAQTTPTPTTTQQLKARALTAELKLPERDPTIVALAYRKQRFYLFTRREPAEGEDAAVRARARALWVFVSGVLLLCTLPSPPYHHQQQQHDHNNSHPTTTTATTITTITTNISRPAATSSTRSPTPRSCSPPRARARRRAACRAARCCTRPRCAGVWVWVCVEALAATGMAGRGAASG